jgi:hypothetical protein
VEIDQCWLYGRHGQLLPLIGQLASNTFHGVLCSCCNRDHILACFIARFIDLRTGDIQRLFILKSFFGCCMLSKICFNSSSVSDLFSFPVEAAFIK